MSQINNYIDNKISSEVYDIDEINDNTRTNKIFVGNVPYDCTACEFVECFKNMEGFMKAELINNTDKDKDKDKDKEKMKDKIKDNNSRGFGFITFVNNSYAHNVLIRNDIFIRDRKLRFTPYTIKKNKITTTNNYILLENITEDITRDDIYNEFKNYSDIGKCFIMCDRDTGQLLNKGLIEIYDNDSFIQLINLEQLYINNKIIKLSQYVNNDKQILTNVNRLLNTIHKTNNKRINETILY